MASSSSWIVWDPHMFDVLFAHAQGAVLEIEPKETKKNNVAKYRDNFHFLKKRARVFNYH
jgi:hypothetical protein